jgi:integrating conjugative element protein (TIGR03746 family)
MSRARDSSEAKDAHIRTLRRVLMGFAILFGLLLFALIRANQNLRIYSPPDLREGAELRANDVPPVYAYEFGVALWKKIHLWESDGAKDFERNINRYQFYLTPSCRSYLKMEASLLAKNGELKGRVRSLREMDEYPYEASNVTPVSFGVWNVSLAMRLEETLNATVVKDNEIRYPLRIVTYDVDVERNPWGLAIDCYSEKPTLIQNRLLGAGA